MTPISDEARGLLGSLEDAKGLLDAEHVVQAAKPEDSPLHEHFVWDDKAAAHQARLIQAQQLIRRVRITITSSKVDISVPAYIARVRSVGYVSLQKMPNEDREATMRRELIALAGLAARVNSLADAWDIPQVQQRLTRLCSWLDKYVE